MGFGFPKEERELLVSSEPDKFKMPSASDMRYNWVHVWLDAIGHDEMRELVLDAWQMVVPKKVAAEYLRAVSRPGRDESTRPATSRVKRSAPRGRSASTAGRRDVLVVVEQVLRVIRPLHLAEAGEVGAVVVFHLRLSSSDMKFTYPPGSEYGAMAA